MEYKEYHTTDKSDWDRGEWDNEPDKIQFVDEATGLPCLIKRSCHFDEDGKYLHGSGILCGYVGVPPGHPLHGKEYSEIDNDFDVHGGLTFANECGDGPEDKDICHVPGPGEPDSVWWLGFDCGHGFDFSPGFTSLRKLMPSYGMLQDESYRNVAYVKAECAKLAAQINAMR